MFAMKPCVGLYISGILTEDFDSIAKTIQTFFSCSEDKPAAFDDWAKNIAYDKRNGEIRTVGEACVIPGQYQSFFQKLAEGCKYSLSCFSLSSVHSFNAQISLNVP